MPIDPVDVLVVGSGASAVNAAYPLVSAGRTVRMLDFGNRDTTYERMIPERSFSELRRTDHQQHRYFLGERFEGIGFDHVGAGAQLTPPRQYVCRDSATLLPIQSESFFPLQSLAEGGLAGAWGAGSPAFCNADLAGFPITAADLQPHYEGVAERIGISGARDDAFPFLGELNTMQPAVETDDNGKSILRRYELHRARNNRRGLYVGRPRLAMLSQPHRGRQGTRYWDMDFWSDAGRSVYRPRWTVDELRAFSNFSFVGGRLVQRFEETAGGDVVVSARDVDSGRIESYRSRVLILAAGTLGTARIVLRSLQLYGQRVPIVSNPHTYMALLNFNTLGRQTSDLRHSLAQLCLVYAPDGSARPFTVGHLYSYRSLLLFRLMKGNPLPFRQGLEVLRLLSPALCALILQHPDRPTSAKYCELQPDSEGGEDRLAVEYGLSSDEQREIDTIEARIARALLRLHCLRVRTVRPGHAASAHFAGTFPMSNRDERLTTSPNGRLNGSRNVYLADGSLFPSLPSKGLTFTMMANADRIGTNLSKSLAP